MANASEKLNSRSQQSDLQLLQQTAAETRGIIDEILLSLPEIQETTNSCSSSHFLTNSAQNDSGDGVQTPSALSFSSSAYCSGASPCCSTSRLRRTKSRPKLLHMFDIRKESSTKQEIDEETSASAKKSISPPLPPLPEWVETATAPPLPPLPSQPPPPSQPPLPSLPPLPSVPPPSSQPALPPTVSEHHANTSSARKNNENASAFAMRCRSIASSLPNTHTDTQTTLARTTLAEEPRNNHIDRDTVAQEIWTLGMTTRQKYRQNIAFSDVGDRLIEISIAVARVPETTYAETLLARRLTVLAARCSLIDSRMATNIWLVVADYYAFTLRFLGDAAHALERAASYIERDVRRTVGLLEKSRELYEQAQQYEHALRIERRLESFDLSVDWIARSRARQEQLAKKVR